MPTAVPFHHDHRCLSGIPGARLTDQTGLSAVVIAAASAAGLPPHGPPVARAGPRGVVIGLLCHGGHVVLHTVPEAGLCLVDTVAPTAEGAARSLEVIARRLGAEVSVRSGG